MPSDVSGKAGPTIGPIVINEIMYHPPFGEPEWFELKNISARTVDLGTDLWVVVEGVVVLDQFKANGGQLHGQTAANGNAI